MWGKKKILVSRIYVHRDIQKTSNVQNKRRNKDLWGLGGGEGYSDKLFLTLQLYNVHSFLCLRRAAKDGIFKISSMS